MLYDMFLYLVHNEKSTYICIVILKTIFFQSHFLCIFDPCEGVGECESRHTSVLIVNPKLKIELCFPES